SSGPPGHPGSAALPGQALLPMGEGKDRTPLREERERLIPSRDPVPNMQQAIDSILQAMKQERHADALNLSRALHESLPKDEGVRSLLAASEQNAGDLDAARELLVDLTRDHPGTWQHWNNLGNVRRLLDDLEGAGQAYAEALKLNPGSAKLRANLGLLHLNLGNFAKAQEQLGQACAMPGAEPGMRVWAA